MRIVLLACLALLAGCVGPAPDVQPTPDAVPASAPFALGHLSGRDARVEDAPDARTFVWQGRGDLPVDRYMPGMDDPLRKSYDFEVDGAVGKVEARATTLPEKTLIVRLLGSSGETLCEIDTGDDPVCSFDVREGAPLAAHSAAVYSWGMGIETFVLEHGSLPFELRVTLLQRA